MSDVFLSLDGLEKTFEGSPSPAVSDVSFSMPEGEILALLGPSGCGKTTTLRLIAGFETPDRGTIRIGGRIVQSDDVELPPEERRVGFVFQDYALFPHLDVRRNVEFGLSGLPPVIASGALARRSICAASRGWNHAFRTSFPVANSNAPRSRGRSLRGTSFFCWTSRCRTWTRHFARACVKSFGGS